MRWYSSDSHFGHGNIIKYCNRPFSNVNEMNEVILKNINDVVKPEDDYIHLGDFCFGNATYFLDRINCNNIYFCVGSHDKDLWNSRHHRKIKKIEDILYFKDVVPSIVCNHCAQLVWDKSHYGAWHLYGHSHGNLGKSKAEFEGITNISEAINIITSTLKMMDVGVDTNNFKPYSYDQIKAIMDSREGCIIKSRAWKSNITEKEANLIDLKDFPNNEKKYLYNIEHFKTFVKDYANDIPKGIFYYATDSKISNVEVSITELFNQKPPTWATHITWITPNV
jgi:calcineurin-like phosphoesterase family protein